jgi:hypothetical protein
MIDIMNIGIYEMNIAGSDRDIIYVLYVSTKKTWLITILDDYPFPAISRARIYTGTLTQIDDAIVNDNLVTIYIFRLISIYIIP